MKSSNICQQGTIKNILGNTLFVEIKRHAACSGCQAKSFCPSSEKKEEIFPVPTKEPQLFQIGEEVQLTLKKSLGNKAVIIAYLFPFIVLTTGLFITYHFTKNDLISIGIAFVATTLYYLFLKKIDKKIEKHFSFSVNKIKE